MSRDELQKIYDNFNFTFTDAIMQELISALLSSKHYRKVGINDLSDFAYRIANNSELNALLDSLLAEVLQELH